MNKKENMKKVLLVQRLEEKDDPLKEYREKEPMTPAKEKAHEPTAIKREMTENLTEPGKKVPNPVLETHRSLMKFINTDIIIGKSETHTDRLVK